MSSSENVSVSTRGHTRGGEASRIRIRGPGIDGARARILVIDDEPLLGRTLTFMLEERHDVVVISSGRDALEWLENDWDFDLVLCDLDMPEVNGKAVYETVVKTHPELARRFVFMTGGACSPWSEDFMASYSGLQLEKPFTTDDVEQVLDLVG
jgi:DNA-binding NtrC family response regulator